MSADGPREGANAGAPILVVDDDSETRAEIRDALEAEGHAVIEAADGKEALELLTSGQTTEPRLIVLDLSMPVMTGQECLAVLKSYHRLSWIPVIVISGAATDTDIAAWKNGAVSGHLAKPFAVRELLAMVAAAVAGRG